MKDEIISKKLNMTLEQMENEIVTMRAFDKWLNGVAFNKEDYDKLCMEFVKDMVARHFEKIDPKFAEEIRSGILDDKDEVLS